MQDQLDKNLGLSKDTIEGKARDHEIVGTKQNMFCSGQIKPSKKYKQNYDNIKWQKD